MKNFGIEETLSSVEHKTLQYVACMNTFALWYRLTKNANFWSVLLKDVIVRFLWSSLFCPFQWQCKRNTTLLLPPALLYIHYFVWKKLCAVPKQKFATLFEPWISEMCSWINEEWEGGETKFQKKVYEKHSVKWYFFHKILEIVAFFYKNSIKPSTYSVRIFTKDLELQLSKKCTNRIYYFSVSLSTSSSSSLSFLYFFSFLHIFTCFEALPPEFFIFCITNHNLGLFRLELSADDKLIYLRRNILDSMWLCGL